MVKIGIVGAGGWARSVHAPAFKRAGAWIKGVYSRNPAHAGELAGAYGARAFSEYAALLAEVDAVSIATPDYTHAEYASLAAAAGVHVLVEKPLGRNLAEAQVILKAVGAAGVVGMTALTSRGDPYVQTAKRRVEEGLLGELLYLRGSYNADYLADPALPAPWRTRALEAGPAGVLGDLGPHLFDLARFISGHEFEAVFAEARILLDRGHKVENPDEAAVMARMYGATGAFSLSRVHQPVGMPGGLSLELQGDRGAMWLQPGTLKISTRPGDYAQVIADPDLEEDRRTPLGWGLYQFVELTRRFVRAVELGEANSSPGIEDGVIVQRVIDAAVTSVTEGGWRST